MPLDKTNKKRLLERVFNEPLSAETESKRKYLLFVACFSILLAVYGVKVTKTPWLEIEVPSGAPDILQGAMATALVYTFLTFVLHAWSDLRRWYTANDLLSTDEYFEPLLGARNELHAVKHWLDTPLPPDPAKVEAIRKMHDDAARFFDKLETAVESIEASHRRLTALQLVRILTLDLGIPLALGLFAMYKVGDAFFPFIGVVFL